MNLAKVSANGQITVPVEIRRRLGLRSGDKMLFYILPDGRIIVDNASPNALRKAQNAFQGVADELGLKDEDDVMNLISEMRAKEK